MRGLLSVLLVIACPAILMAGAAETSELDAVNPAVDASAPSPSMNSNGEEKAPAEKTAVEKPILPAANDLVQHDPNAAKEETPVEQTSSPPAAEAAEAKRGDEFAAPESQAGNAAETSGLTDSMCLILESAAAANGLPLEFVARVIWQESRFKPNAIGPTTRTGHRAQGIAQFMPYTATERGLLNPLDPETALPEAAEFLAELRREFGNLGLAAAAYNAGPGRVRDFIDGRGVMPAQTRHYVRAITGRSVEEWAALGRETGKDGITRPTSCRSLAALLKEPPAFGPIERKLRDAASRPGGISDGRNASAGQSMTKRLSAGPVATVSARNKEVRTASLPTTAARANAGRSAASPDSKRSSGTPASSITQTAAPTRSDSKLASARLAIVSPKSIAQENFIARGAHPRGSKAAQNSKPVQVHTASLSSARAARLTKTSPSVVSFGSRRSSEAPTGSRGPTAPNLRSTSAGSRAADSKPALVRSRTVPLNGIAQEKSTIRVAALRGSVGARTTADRATGQPKMDAALAPSSRSAATRAKSEKRTGQLATSAVSTRSESKARSDRVRGVARHDAVKASEDRLRKIMQICRGC